MADAQKPPVLADLFFSSSSEKCRPIGMVQIGCGLFALLCQASVYNTDSRIVVESFMVMGYFGTGFLVGLLLCITGGFSIYVAKGKTLLLVVYGWLSAFTFSWLLVLLVTVISSLVLIRNDHEYHVTRRKADRAMTEGLLYAADSFLLLISIIGVVAFLMSLKTWSTDLGDFTKTKLLAKCRCSRNGGELQPPQVVADPDRESRRPSTGVASSRQRSSGYSSSGETNISEDQQPSSANGERSRESAVEVESQNRNYLLMQGLSQDPIHSRQPIPSLIEVLQEAHVDAANRLSVEGEGFLDGYVPEDSAYELHEASSYRNTRHIHERAQEPTNSRHRMVLRSSTLDEINPELHDEESDGYVQEDPDPEPRGPTGNYSSPQPLNLTSNSASSIKREKPGRKLKSPENFATNCAPDSAYNPQRHYNLEEIAAHSPQGTTEVGTSRGTDQPYDVPQLGQRHIDNRPRETNDDEAGTSRVYTDETYDVPPTRQHHGDRSAARQRSKTDTTARDQGNIKTETWQGDNDVRPRQPPGCKLRTDEDYLSNLAPDSVKYTRPQQPHTNDDEGDTSLEEAEPTYDVPPSWRNPDLRAKEDEVHDSDGPQDNDWYDDSDDISDTMTDDTDAGHVEAWSARQRRQSSTTNLASFFPLPSNTNRRKQSQEWLEIEMSTREPTMEDLSLGGDNQSPTIDLETTSPALATYPGLATSSTLATSPGLATTSHATTGSSPTSPSTGGPPAMAAPRSRGQGPLPALPPSRATSMGPPPTAPPRSRGVPPALPPSRTPSTGPTPMGPSPTAPPSSRGPPPSLPPPRAPPRAPRSSRQDPPDETNTTVGPVAPPRRKPSDQ